MAKRRASKQAFGLVRQHVLDAPRARALGVVVVDHVDGLAGEGAGVVLGALGAERVIEDDHALRPRDPGDEGLGLGVGHGFDLRRVPVVGHGRGRGDEGEALALDGRAGRGLAAVFDLDLAQVVLAPAAPTQATAGSRRLGHGGLPGVDGVTQLRADARHGPSIRDGGGRPCDHGRMSLVLPNTRGVTLLAIASLASTLGLGACGGRVEGSSTSEIHSEPGPTPSEPDSVVVEPAPGPRALEGTHVVVRSGARFFPSAEAKEPVVTRSFLSDEAAPPGTLAARTIGWVMAAGELHGSRVEVRSLGGEDDSSSCGHNFAGLDDMEVRMWVERSDLVVVTTGFVEATYADGSGLSIPPGAPIVPDSPLPEGLDGADEPGPWLATWGFERSLAKAEFAEDGPLVTGQAFVPAERPPLANLAEPEGHCSSTVANFGPGAPSRARASSEMEPSSTCCGRAASTSAFAASRRSPRAPREGWG